MSEATAEAGSRSAVRRSSGNWAPMARLAVSMMLHDRPKLAGNLLGVVFATVLMLQQLGIFAGLVTKNTLFVDRTEAAVWVVPPGTQQPLPQRAISDTVLARTRSVEGVAWAEPLLMGTASMLLPEGGREAVTLVGTKLPRLAGGPFSVVAGDPEHLGEPAAVFVDDGQRDDLGDVDLGSVRELGGHRVVVRGFTWGLLPFGPGYAFASYDTARDILPVPAEQTSFVLVGVRDDTTPPSVRDRLAAHLGESVEVLTSEAFASRVRTRLIREQLGLTFGTSTLIALIVGFVIVALSMFSAVVDNVREFGTLKAMGATTLDLTKLLVVQALVYAGVGTTIGLTLAIGLAELIRSAELVLVMPPALLLGTYPVMAVLCVLASMLAVLRVRNIEPGLVFQ